MDWTRGSGLIEYVGEARLVFDHPDFRMEKADLNQIFANYDGIGSIFLRREPLVGNGHRDYPSGGRRRDARLLS